MRALSDLDYIAIDIDLLDALLTWDQTGIYEVNEISGTEVTDSDDWMLVLLQTRALQRIPPANLQSLFMRMQHLPVRAGDVIMRQGDEGVLLRSRKRRDRETPLNRERARRTGRVAFGVKR